MTRRPTDESTVDGDFAVTLPPEIREQVDVEPGDRIRWRVGDDGALAVEVVSCRYGAFASLEPVDTGEATDAAADHDSLAGDE